MVENDHIDKTFSYIVYITIKYVEKNKYILKNIKMLGRNVTVDLVLDRGSWRELLMAAQVLQGPLS